MDLVKQIILGFIQPLSKNGHQGFHQKHDDLHYLDTILYVLKTGIAWREIVSDTHFSTYHKKFMFWAKNKVFQNSYYAIIALLHKSKKLCLKNLFIDTTMIKNIKGVETIGVNHYDRGRKGTKLSLIVTNKGIPLGISIDKSNIHDIHLVDPTLVDVKIKIIGSRLIADKGYVSKPLVNKLKDKHDIRMITPLKVNDKRKLTTFDRTLLGKRNIIENVFSWLKANRRIQLRYDKTILAFEQFVYLGLIKLIGKKSLL